MDNFQAVSNLWEEFSHYLRPCSPPASKILALAADPLTENVFLVSKTYTDFRNIGLWKNISTQQH
jgi:hypothetical protein